MSITSSDSYQTLNKFLVGLEGATAKDFARPDADEDLDLMEPTGVE